MPESSSRVEVGQVVAGFQLPSGDGREVHLREYVGSPLLLFMYRDATDGACTEALRNLQDASMAIGGKGINLLGVGASPEGAQTPPLEQGVDFPLLWDRTGETLDAYQLRDGESRAYLLDAGLRVQAIYEGEEMAILGRRVIADAERMLVREPARDVVQQAPVLIIPKVLSDDLCRRLIHTWKTQGNRESGFMRDVDGRTVTMTDPEVKIRRDHLLEPGELHDAVTRQVARWVIPRIRMAFHFPVTRRENYRIACYDAARGGYFRAHRDNTTAGTAHRRFAMSLLLNEDYEGGYLRFPEFGAHRYRPQAGDAVIFSCSILHEATDVTAGERYVLLSFLYGEEEARLREAYHRRSGGSYTA